MDSEVRIIAPCGIIGYCFPEEHFFKALDKHKPHAIVADAGSTDPGAYYLGSGTTHIGRITMKQDLRAMIMGGRRHGIPVIIGSAGTAGGNSHVDWTLDIVQEIGREEGLNFNVAVIRAEPDRAYLKDKLGRGAIKALAPNVPTLSPQVIDDSACIVGMMGPEPIIAALAAGADVVIAGRSTDAGIFAAVPLSRGIPAGLAWHMGKILECGAYAATPMSIADGMIATLTKDYFIVEPTSPSRACTCLTVAAHVLYESSGPIFREPPGTLDVTDATYEQVSDRAVRVKGSKFEVADQYTIRLEGAEKLGFRAISVAGTRDPLLISRIDDHISKVREIVRDAASAFASEKQYDIVYRLYGKNAVMGDREPEINDTPHELGVVVEVIAETPDLASAILTLARTFTLTTDFPGRMCTAGNLAYAHSPHEIHTGYVYRFNILHAVDVADAHEIFKTEMSRV